MLFSFILFLMNHRLWCIQFFFLNLFLLLQCTMWNKEQNWPAKFCISQQKQKFEYFKYLKLCDCVTWQACVKRVEGDDTGSKHCTGQYFDYFKCIDECVRIHPWNYDILDGIFLSCVCWWSAGILICRWHQNFFRS